MKTWLKWMGWMWLVAGAVAGPLPRTEVSAQAKWVLHLDAEQFRVSKVGQHFVEHMLAQHLAEIEGKIGFDFGPYLDSVASATVYGLDFAKREENTAVVVLRGAVREAQGVEEFLSTHSGKGRRAKLRQLQTTPFALFKVESGFAALLTNGTVVMARTQKLVENACEVMAGRQPHVTGTRFEALANPAKPYLLAAASEGTAAELSLPRNMKIFRKVEGVQFVVREVAAHLSLELALKTGSAESATQIKTVADGFLELGKVERINDKNVQALLRSAKVTTEGKTVTGTFEFSNKRAIALMKRGNAARAEAK